MEETQTEQPQEIICSGGITINFGHVLNKLLERTDTDGE